MIRIVSDGTSAGTRVLDVESGEDLTARLLIQKVEWTVSAERGSGLARATLTIDDVEMDVLGVEDTGPRE